MSNAVRVHPLPGALTRLRTLALVCGAAALAACTNLSGLGAASEFQCKAPEGIPCQSISGVHHNERAGNLPAQRMGRGDHAGSAAASTSASTSATARMAAHGGGEDSSAEGGVSQASTAQAPAAPAYRKATVSAPDRIGPGGLGAIRSDPTVIRIWVAPWEDSDGDLNDQSYVYMQVDAGRWLIEHNRAQIRREFSPRPQQALVAPRGTVLGSSGQGASPGARGMTPAAPTSAGAVGSANAAHPGSQGVQGVQGSRMQLPAELAEMLRKAAERGAAQGAQGGQIGQSAAGGGGAATPAVRPNPEGVAQ